MNTYSDNFSFINGTLLQEFENDLIISEVSLSLNPNIVKITARKIAEFIAKDIQKRFNCEEPQRDTFNSYLKVIKTEIEQVEKDFHTIRINGNATAHHMADNEPITMVSDFEIMKILHNLLIWYLKKIGQISKSTVKFYKEPNIRVIIEDLNNNKSELLKKEHEISNKKIEIESLNNKITELKNSKDAVDNKLSSNEDENLKLRKELIEVNEEKENLNKQYVQLQKEKEGLHNALTEKQLVVQQYHIEQNNTSTEINSLKEKLTYLNYRLEQKKEQLQKVKNENQLMTSEITSITSKAKKEEQKYYKLSTELQNNINKNMKLISESDKKLESLQEKVNYLENEHTESKVRIETLIDKEENLKIQLESCNKNKENLEVTINEIEIERNSLVKRIGSLEEILLYKETIIEKVKQENNALNTTLAEKTSDIVTLKTKLKELDLGIANLNKENQVIIKSIKDENDKIIISIKNENDDMLKIIKEQNQDDIKELEAQKAQIIFNYEIQLKKQCDELVNLKNQYNTLLDNEKNIAQIIIEYKTLLEEAQKQSNKERARIAILQKEKDEAQRNYIEKEQQLVRVEHENEKLLKELIDLRNKDIRLEEKIKETEEELENLKETCKKSYDLLQNYQEIIENCKYVHNNMSLAPLEERKEVIKNDIAQDDQNFTQALIVADSKLIETRERKDELNNFFSKEGCENVKYLPFYKSFLAISGHELRVIYVLLTKLDLSTILLSKAKQFFSSEDTDMLSKYINSKALEYSSVSEYELKLEIFYKMIKLSDVQNINNLDKDSIGVALDHILVSGYEQLLSESSFVPNDYKIEGICNYYLLKVFDDVANKLGDNRLSLDIGTLTRIYDAFNILNNTEKQILFNKLNVSFNSKEEVLSYINMYPLQFLSATINVAGTTSYMKAFNMLINNSSVLNQNLLESTYNGGALMIIFTNQILMLMISMGHGRAKAKTDLHLKRIMPLIIVQTLTSLNVVDNVKHIDLTLNNMIKLWNVDRINYMKLTAAYNAKRKVLNSTKSDLNVLQNKSNQLQLAKHTLTNELNDYSNQYSDSIITSNKVKKLPSYHIYTKLCSEKLDKENKVKAIKSKNGLLKSFVDKDSWKNQGEILKINHAIKKAIEKLSIEAKSSTLFESENRPFKDINTKLNGIQILIEKNNTEINNKLSMINKVERELSESEKLLNLMDTKLPKLPENYQVQDRA